MQCFTVRKKQTRVRVMGTRKLKPEMRHAIYTRRKMWIDVIKVAPGIYQMPSGTEIEVLKKKDFKEEKNTKGTAKVKMLHGTYKGEIYFTFNFLVLKKTVFL